MFDSTNPRVMADNIRTLNVRNLANADAIEALGSYSATEVDTGKKWIDNSTIYRKIFFVESLPNTTTSTIRHNITNLKNVINLAGISQATESASGLPFPYATTLLLRYTATEIAITASGDSSSQSAYIIMEYTKFAAPSALTSPAPDDSRSIEPEEIPEEIPESEPINEELKKEEK